MMTIDEAIKHCEEVAEKYCEKVEEELTADDFCDSCASEHRQLAEWLKELKKYKDFEDKGYVMCRFEVTQDDRYRTTKMVLDFNTKELYDNIVEVNADESQYMWNTS